MEQRRTLPLSTNGFNLRPMVAAVIYVRVSTKEQTENLSLPTQLRACEEYCRREGYEVLERFTEQGESAKTTDRTELQKLLNYCRTHKGKVHFVVVYNLTRFAREKYDHFALRALLKSLGISLRSATEPIDDTSTGKLMEGVLAAFAQFDNDVRADRTRAGMRAALEQGRWTFIPPLGYLNAPKWSGKSLAPDPDRAPLVTRAFDDFATGRFTKEEVLDTVTRLGLRTRKGLQLNPQSFGRMLTNRLYRRLHRCSRVRDFATRRLRSAGERGHVSPCASNLAGPSTGYDTASARSAGLSIEGPCSLRDMRQDIDCELVEGTQRALRVLPLLAPMPRGQRTESEARRPIRRRVGTATSNAWLHAAGEGARSARVGAA